MTKQQKIDRLQQRNFHWSIPWKAVSLIANAEDCVLTAYKCSANTWTIGWGETENIRPGMVWTEEQADNTFNTEVNKFANRVEVLCTEYASPNQLGAMTSLAYNIGIGAFRKSTVLKAHNAGDAEAVSRAFHLWNKARINGALVPLRGLVTRRAVESALYLSPEETELPVQTVQTVEPESSLSSSPINKVGVTTATAGGLTILSSLSDQVLPIVGKVKEIASGIGIDPLLILGAMLIGAGIMNLYWRYKQRQGGWA